ncbi:MAG: hypothetical protein N3E52_05035 [Candidatus Bathyarchaeota archaeon]|nr:hypothetical protein [Candidatus Bathyarchaeota archaeon]
MASEICAVFLPPMMDVLPAKPFTISVNKKARMFAHFKIADLIVAIKNLHEPIA